MTNIVQLRPGRAGDQGVTSTAPADATPLVVLLTGMIERIESAGAQAAVLDRPPLQVERVVQALFDAATALEQAAASLIDGDTLR